MILLIDNYDSFTYNLYQQIAALGKEVKVVRNDALSIEDIRNLHPEAIVLSPGPGTPREAGITVDVVKELYNEYPILGICLGHQSIGEAFGGTIIRAENIMHGKLSTLNYEQKGLFEQLNGEIEVMRYHSLVIEPSTIHGDFEIVATSADDGEIMAIQHKQYPVFGLQFHPESIGTETGTKMVEAFLERV
ncbi:anthranilate synthase component II [Lysinibacillus endophyticus]|uniref:Aminodeoxychorismate/anthranilate synthase component II n=1 Tax=Ureibacillus endophyticus TaxID=1978490 RepID=A0A494YZS0_9BACL|nr:aminodeoxychorismate/anthranilate synthase component II [Lysinibacillus endophyticus]MCP1145238.1 aminodeoxychorismate/anthranilate synthase component II [Lysinibacillus endophyticus]RKQ15752.1 aminodeoxychorismate/anthranilate synthase component II [Lysinibacillus endophyticus]